MEKLYNCDCLFEVCSSDTGVKGYILKQKCASCIQKDIDAETASALAEAERKAQEDADFKAKILAVLDITEEDIIKLKNLPSGY